ncbi:Aste57867_22942 [Aphanomyces stellatus]|uniref:Aste57867_22942 protein n=1 Tax=Aphanomyces stellatus TaxID=120398 RepID=A0A485LLC7_9STRA|nr:hypothetical protein As57867_022871 [Aphanomyces stellatus]VFT99592.1 Aste57867_22942 [Aphanomyces stellatus]
MPQPKLRSRADSRLSISFLLNDPKPKVFSSVSMEHQLLLVQAAQLTQHSRPFLPTLFSVPAAQPFPAALHGTTLNVGAYRDAHKRKKLAPAIVAQLDALGFVWDLKRYKWQLHLHALSLYKATFGDTLVPQSFVVPAQAPWPASLHGVPLGRVVGTLRQSMAGLSQAKRAALDALGFTWTLTKLKFSWEDKLLALQTFAVRGHLNVPPGFVVPDQDPAWPPSTWCMPLHQVMHNLRFSGQTGEKKAALDALGFTWHSNQRTKYAWPDKLLALKTYKQLFGHVVVPRSFQVPRGHSDWPEVTWDLQLGVLVNNLRTRDQPSDRRLQLDVLGFVWDTMAFHWQVNLLALRTFHRLHGHVRVPQTFQVPLESDQWPNETWGMKLGWVVTTLRRTRDSIAASRCEELDQLGFVWDNTTNHCTSTVQTNSA